MYFHSKMVYFHSEFNQLHKIIITILLYIILKDQNDIFY